MPRELTGHKVNGCNDGLTVSVIDDPGSGGANHHYRISGFNTKTNPSDPFMARHGEPADYTTILFQNGPIKESGVNGLTHETLTAILIDRFEGFQRGPYACGDNAEVLGHFRAAQEAMLRRTKARLARGVEGTHKV